MVSISEQAYGGLEATVQTDLGGRSTREEILGLQCSWFLGRGCLLCKVSSDCLTRRKKACVGEMPWAIAEVPLAL